MILDELKDILGNLYAQYGLNNDVLRLSMVIDQLINQEMQN